MSLQCTGGMENYDKVSGTNTFLLLTSSMGKPKDIAFMWKSSQILCLDLELCFFFGLPAQWLCSRLFHSEQSASVWGRFFLMQHYIVTLTHMHWQHQLMQLVILTLSFLFDSTFFSRQCSWDGLGCKHQRQRQVKMQFAQTMHKMQVKL